VSAAYIPEKEEPAMTKLKGLNSCVEKIIKLWTDWALRLSLAALGFLVCVTIIDILSNKLLHKPIHGSVDIIGRAFLVVVAFALARTQLLKRHIAVDFVTLRLPKRVRAITEAISNLFIALFLIAAIWACFEYGFNLQETKESSITLGIPSAPFVYAIAIAFCPIVLIHVKEFITSITLAKGGKK